MKILVGVAEVATVEEGFGIEDDRVAPQYLDYELNEWDAYAIEEAAQLAETEDEEIEVVSVTIGPERAEETIRKALAKGVDRAIRIWDDALDGRALLDVSTKMRLLATAVEREQPDLVLTGVQSADSALGATGVSLAATIEYGWAAVVNHLEYTVGAETVTVHRELEGGVESLVEVNLPAVLTLQTGINEPRYASLRGIRGAQDKELAVFDLADLDLDPAAIEPATRLTDMYVPDAASDATMLDGDADEEAAQLAEVLRERGVGR